MTAVINVAYFFLVWLVAGITLLVWWHIADKALHHLHARRRRRADHPMRRATDNPEGER